MRSPGIEPGLLAWKAKVIPLDHDRKCYSSVDPYKNELFALWGVHACFCLPVVFSYALAFAETAGCADFVGLVHCVFAASAANYMASFVSFSERWFTVCHFVLLANICVLFWGCVDHVVSANQKFPVFFCYFTV